MGLRGGGGHRAGTGDQGRQDLPSGGERGFRASVSGVGGWRSMVLLRKPSLSEIHKPSPGSASPHRCEFLSGNFVAEQRALRRGGRLDGDRLLRSRGVGHRRTGYRGPIKNPVNAGACRGLERLLGVRDVSRGRQGIGPIPMLPWRSLCAPVVHRLYSKGIFGPQLNFVRAFAFLTTSCVLPCFWL